MFLSQTTKSITGDDFRGVSVSSKNMHIQGKSPSGTLATVRSTNPKGLFSIMLTGVLVNGDDVHFVNDLRLVSLKKQTILEGGIGTVSSLLDLSLEGGNLVLRLLETAQVSLSIAVRDVGDAGSWVVETSPYLARE